MNRDCIIVHGCPSNKEDAIDVTKRTYDKHWIPWVRERLNASGVLTITPLMPEPWEPNYEVFKAEFEKYPVSEHTILIGHSCGSAFLVRWLGETKQKIDTLILVAPWKIPKADDPGRKAFYEYQIDETIKERVRKIVMFTSNTEKDDGKKSLEMFHSVLGGKVVDLPNKGHYIGRDMGNNEFSELIYEVVAQ